MFSEHIINRTEKQNKDEEKKKNRIKRVPKHKITRYVERRETVEKTSQKIFLDRPTRNCVG